MANELSESEGILFKDNPYKNPGVMAAIIEERTHQLTKWGTQEHSIDRWLVILGEEYGEVCQAAFSYKGDGQVLKRELIQVAAVAVAIVTGIPD